LAGTRIVGRSFTVLFLIVVVLISILPLYWLLISAFKPPGEIFSNPPTPFPSRWTMENFNALFSETLFSRAIVNSIVVSGLYTVLSCLICALTGYVLAKLNAKAKNFVFALTIALLLIPPSVLIVPLFMIVTKMNLANTYLGVILPFIASPFGVFWMRQYTLGFPTELMEAARIDGTKEWALFWKIVLPSVMPGLAALAIFLFMSQWNDFLWPLIVLRTDTMYTIPIALSNLVGVYSNSWGQLMAGAAIATFPFIILFIFLQKYFIEGVLGGSIKE
jgi:ABC-type glycerol-3-phosphate transport system permease component